MPRLPLLAPLVLIALLAFAAPAAAEEEGFETPISDGSELEVEECEVNEEDECVEPEADTEAPPECLLSSAEPAILVSGNADRVRLQVRYASASPTKVAITYGLHGSKGSLYLGDEKKRFGTKGVLRLNRSLTEAQMAKVMAAKDFSVRIRILEAPSYCQDYFDRHLTVRRATPSGLTWLQSE
jgi:hypothetical protein